MNKYLLLIIALITAWTTGAQTYWTPVPAERLSGAEKTERASKPVLSHIFHLNLTAFKSALQAAPSRENYTGPSQVILPFPNGNGKLENFRVYEAAVLHPQLGAQHPDIKSYIGQGIDNPTSTIRFSTTLFGLHVMMFATHGASYTDPYTKDLQHYIVYKKADLKTPHQFSCMTSDDSAGRPELKNSPLSTMASDGILRTYRLALACTIEYAAFHINAAGLNSASLAEKKAAVLAAMNVTMTRVNGVYERDMAITMQIVPNNENIIYVTSDNLTNNSSGALLNQIQSVINNAIGSSNYDIGHVVSTGGGGVASLASVCSSNKARGVTGSSFPVGDPFDIDYVSHEMGHQFGATHTFNNSFQRSAATAVEPGSGSTIMAYAGISPPNVQSNSDAHFHTVSISQMVNFVNGSGGTCATETANGNAAPFINFLNNYTIPKATAFVLRGGAVDIDEEAALTYCWEQVDADGSSQTQDETPSEFSASGPNFRSLPPSASPDRYMPALPNVLAGNLSPTWEVVSSVGRSYTFALTVRDNQVPNGGQTSRDDIVVNVSNTAGPFAVTSQNTSGITWEVGSQQTITWDVAGTTLNNINTAAVNILLSTDGGQTFDTTLAAATLNDGDEVITVPPGISASCRIMVQAVGNIFYAVNSRNFAIDEANAADTFGLQDFKLYPNPNNGSFSVAFSSDSTDAVTIALYDMRGRQVYNNTYKNTGVFTTTVNLQELQSGLYIVTVTDGKNKEMKKIMVQ